MQYYQRMQTKMKRNKEKSYNQRIYRDYKETVIHNKRRVSSNELFNGGSNTKVNKIYKNTQRIV